MKKTLSLFLLLIVVWTAAFSLSSCDGKRLAAKDVKSEAGAMFLMFKSVCPTPENLSNFEFLSFDSASSELSGDELKDLKTLISDFCKDAGIDYFEMNISELKSAGKAEGEQYSEKIINGCLLTYSGCGMSEDENGEFYTGTIDFRWSSLGAVGGCDFVIRRDESGVWYLDTDAYNGGFSQMLS